MKGGEKSLLNLTLYKLNEVTDVCKVGITILYDLMNKGELPYIEIFGKRAITQDSLDRLIFAYGKRDEKEVNENESTQSNGDN